MAVTVGNTNILFDILLTVYVSLCITITCGSTLNLQPANSYKCTHLTPKTASVVPPEDGRLTPETCRGLRHN
jgi:hypothetical protein